MLRAFDELHRCLAHAATILELPATQQLADEIASVGGHNQHRQVPSASAWRTIGAEAIAPALLYLVTEIGTSRVNMTAFDVARHFLPTHSNALLLETKQRMLESLGFFKEESVCRPHIAHDVPHTIAESHCSFRSHRLQATD